MISQENDDLPALRSLSKEFPNVDAALAEIARLSAMLTLPKGTIHVISDIHGDDVKLRHVINNASGTLRPLVERLLGEQFSSGELQEFITLVFYPYQSLEVITSHLADNQAHFAFVRRALHGLITLIRYLARNANLEQVRNLMPADYRSLMLDLLQSRNFEGEYLDALTHSLIRCGNADHLLRLTVRLVRNLAIEELVIGGDFWDRGPRGDRVVDYLMRQPHVAITWGNHDTAWMGACLGHEALIAHVLRISARYRRFSQLEEGYGITLQPLENLVRTVYADDPAACFTLRGEGLRPKVQMARMQKAAAVMQFKLEGQMIQRNPEYGLDHRRLLHRIDLKGGTVRIPLTPPSPLGQAASLSKEGGGKLAACPTEGREKTYPLRDTHWPTLDPKNPYELSSEERACMDRLRKSFLSSQKLWEHVQYLIRLGSMHLVRDRHLIFHGCLAVDEKGDYLSMVVDGKPCRGRELFEALNRVVLRVLENPPSPPWGRGKGEGEKQRQKDLDLLWYMWCGPLSPLFGKDKIATFENDLIEDKATHEEIKNPYFRLIHEIPFCEKILSEFGVDPKDGLIVNGHVPVKIDKGESPLKRSGKAITIDGAFSQAYGDHGYTLVLEPERTFLAKHHHFESVEAAVRDGIDIIPSIMEVKHWTPPRKVADTERGQEIRQQIQFLEQLVQAYRDNRIGQQA